MKTSTHRLGAPVRRPALSRILVRRLLFILLLGAAALGGVGCTGVQPWERASLASYPMRPDRDPLALAMGEHIFFSRESSTGGRGVGGSGCGCN